MRAGMTTLIQTWAAHAKLSRVIDAICAMAAPQRVIEVPELEEAFLDVVISQALVRMDIDGQYKLLMEDNRRCK